MTSSAPPLSLIDKYEVTDGMRSSLARIDEARALLESHLNGPEEWSGVIRRQVEAAVVHYSTAIEGNILTRDQVESIIAGEAVEAPEKDKVEAQNYYRAMRWAQTRSLDPNWRMSHETILTLHFMVGSDLGPDYEPLGQYRPHQNSVQDRATGQTIYYPPKPAETIPAMEEFVRWARLSADRDTSPYIVNALAHLNFVAIHPFSDGNGRVGRLLCSLLMMRVGYRAQAFWSLEQFLGEHAQEYGDLLRSTLGPRWDPERVVATRWIEWYLDAVAAQVSNSQRSLRKSIAEFTVVLAGLSTTDSLPADPKALMRTVVPVWLAITGGSVTRRQLIRYLRVSPDTLTRDLRGLASSSLLTAKGSGRGSHYEPGSAVRNWGDFSALVEIAETGTVTDVRRAIAGSLGLQGGLFGAAP